VSDSHREDLGAEGGKRREEKEMGSVLGLLENGKARQEELPVDPGDGTPGEAVGDDKEVDHGGHRDGARRRSSSDDGSSASDED
jgi:hypothetical protein